MKQVMMRLNYSGLIELDKCNVLEMFGFFGLWHTKDYVKYVKHIDFFEIDKKIIRYAKLGFRNDNVDFYCGDSIQYIGNTDKKYDLVIADSPICLDVYDKETGIPNFLGDMFRVSAENGALIFNIKTKHLTKYKKIREKIQLTSTKEVKDIFFVVRNKKITYVVVALGASLCNKQE